MECQGRIQTDWGRKSKCTHHIKALKSSHLQEKKSYSLGRSLFFPCVYCTAVSFHSMGVKILASPHLVIISYTVTKPKKMPFYVMNYSENTLKKSFLQIAEFTITSKTSPKSQRHTAHFGFYCFIVTIYLWISSASLQFSGLFLLPPSSNSLPSRSLWCCIIPLPSHGFQNKLQLRCVSKPQDKGKIAATSAKFSFRHTIKFISSEGVYCILK